MIFLSLLPWAGASRKLWQLLSVVLWDFLQHRVLVSLPQLDDTRPGGDNEPYKEKWRCKNKMKSRLCSFEGKKAFTDVKICSQFHLRCASCPKWIWKITNSPGRLISWPENQNINSVQLNFKTGLLFPFVLFFCAIILLPRQGKHCVPALTAHQHLRGTRKAVQRLGTRDIRVVQGEAREEEVVPKVPNWCMLSFPPSSQQTDQTIPCVTLSTRPCSVHCLFMLVKRKHPKYILCAPCSVRSIQLLLFLAQLKISTVWSKGKGNQLM